MGSALDGTPPPPSDAVRNNFDPSSRIAWSFMDGAIPPLSPLHLLRVEATGLPRNSHPTTFLRPRRKKTPIPDFSRSARRSRSTRCTTSRVAVFPRNPFAPGEGAFPAVPFVLNVPPPLTHPLLPHPFKERAALPSLIPTRFSCLSSLQAWPLFLPVAFFSRKLS